MAQTELDSDALMEWVRFRCPEDLKKALGHLALDEGVQEGAICVRLLTEAVEREELRRKKVRA